MAETQNTTLASRRLVGVEFEQVSNLPEKKNIQKYIKFWAWSNNVNFDPNATGFLKCSVLVPLRRYFKIWLPVNQHYRSTTYVYLQERMKELYPLLANLLYMLILSTMMEIPWVLEGVNLFIIHSFLFNILFYLQLFWLWMEKPRTKYG